MADADHVFPSALNQPEDLMTVSQGSDLYPDDGATVILNLALGHGTRLNLAGRGVDGAVDLQVGKVPPAFWEMWAFDKARVDKVKRSLPYLIDRAIGEASLYYEDLAALALAQTGGEMFEAVLAWRTTQPRLTIAEPVEQDGLFTHRRISAAFKHIPGADSGTDFGLCASDPGDRCVAGRGV